MSGINPRFRRLSQSWQVAHVLHHPFATRCKHLVRLACVKYAASVRPERQNQTLR